METIDQIAGTLDETTAVKALAALAQAGLVSSEARGRNLIYRADFAQMTALLGYLTEHCCEGGACEIINDTACSEC